VVLVSSLRSDAWEAQAEWALRVWPHHFRLLWRLGVEEVELAAREQRGAVEVGILPSGRRTGPSLGR